MAFVSFFLRKNYAIAVEKPGHFEAVSHALVMFCCL